MAKANKRIKVGERKRKKEFVKDTKKSEIYLSLRRKVDFRPVCCQ